MITNGQAFKELRERLGLSLEEAAAELGEADFVLSTFEDDESARYEDEAILQQIYDA